jgi:hypothetical protein
MTKRPTAARVAVIAACVLAIGIGSMTMVAAKKPGGGGGGGGCPRDIACPDVWDPVICSDGVVYSNACYAYRACATGCVDAPGGPTEI